MRAKLSVNRMSIQAFSRLVLVAGLSFFMLGMSSRPSDAESNQSPAVKALLEEVAVKGRVRVIVSFRVADAAPSPAAVAAARSQLLKDLAEVSVSVIREYSMLPLLTLEIDRPALLQLLRHPQVLSIKPDRISRSMTPSADKAGNQ